ncbi:MAG: TlpA disulfide reductase family protein [Agriterribacter sp.]
MQGFIDGTNTFLTTFSEYYFSDYKINNKTFPDLAMIQIPSNFSLEKPKVSLPLLKDGTKAPEVELSYADGKLFNLEKEKGKVVLLNFTINGCSHCIEAIETLNRLFTKHKSENFQIVSINAYDNKESILKFNNRFNVKYPAFIKSEKTNKTLEDYHVDNYPTFYLIDKQGNIARTFSGYYPTLEAELNNAIDKINDL